VSAVTNNSTGVSPFSIFTAIRGSGRDGHDFIGAAIDAGAKAVIHSSDLPSFRSGINYIKVSDPYSAYARLVECYYDFPARKLKIIGVTGTNGKTSSVYLLNSVLGAAGLKCGVITTVCYEWPGYSRPAERTTPEASEIQKLFSDMLADCCSHAIMEASSHALHQNRTGTAKFAAAIFTNLTGDHLDYHKDMASYFNAKKGLFEKHLDPNGTAVINIDDPYGQSLAGSLKNVNCVTFGKEAGSNAVIKISGISARGTEFELRLKDCCFKISSPLIGEHNAYNISGVALLAYSLGISPDIIQSALSQPINIPGRLEAFHTDGGVSVFVDYAHSDDALMRVLESLNRLKEKRIICVFGCGGDRDRTKRPRMGAISANFADRTIITSDNPRTENPLAIIEEIKYGIPKTANFAVVPDRREAIKQAISEAESGDIVLIAGKGHEDYQEINGIKYPFDDREEVRKFIK
ncbi:MAG: UDP-N-acetylmuramoyl-L-alanyl-D-glutamate--2,6-diaminopimelate ligase, partial [Victivallales bacterium]|jgi:UDP-N-acetylmuramoyl-L-alanyl-D-glutamate--2,6-diaminopimelate ligase